MTAAALLICMTIVTNLEHGSVANRVCQYDQQVVGAMSQNTTTVIAKSPVNVEDAKVNEVTLAVAPASAKTIKPIHRIHRKRTFRAARMHRSSNCCATIAKPALKAAENKEFRYSWFQRLMDL